MNNSRKAAKAQLDQHAQGEPLKIWEKDRFHLRQHLHRLVDADLAAARQALEGSQEHAPEMYLIAQYQPAKYWADAVMNSDSMHSLMDRPRSSQDQEELMQSLLEMDDLQSLLERLP